MRTLVAGVGYIGECTLESIQRDVMLWQQAEYARFLAWLPASWAEAERWCRNEGGEAYRRKKARESAAEMDAVKREAWRSLYRCSLYRIA